MGEFTLIDDRELDRKIQRDLDICVAELKDEFGEQLVCLQLVGGYGRGEGGVLRKDGQHYPKNNYDFLIVLKKFHWQRSKLIQKLKARLNSKLLIKFEPSIRSVAEIARAPLIMFYYDVYHMSQCVYGQDVKTLMPAVFREHSQLPRSESLKILRNRLFLYALLEQQHKHMDYEITEEQRKIWFAKFVIGLGDAFAILLGDYRVSYREKQQAFQVLDLTQFGLEAAEVLRLKELHYDVSDYRLQGKDYTLRPLAVGRMLQNYLSKLCQQRELFTQNFVNKVYSLLEARGKSRFKNIVLNLREFMTLSPLAPMDYLLPYILLYYIDEKRCLQLWPSSLKRRFEGKDFRQEFLSMYEKYLV